MFGNAPPARTIPSAFTLGLIIAETVQWIRLDLARLFDPLAHDCQQAMPLRKNPVLALKRCLLCRGREKIEYGRPCPVTDNPTHDLSPPVPRYGRAPHAVESSGELLQPLFDRSQIIMNLIESMARGAAGRGLEFFEQLAPKLAHSLQRAPIFRAHVSGYQRSNGRGQ